MKKCKSKEKKNFWKSVALPKKVNLEPCNYRTPSYGCKIYKNIFCKTLLDDNKCPLKTADINFVESNQKYCPKCENFLAPSKHVENGVVFECLKCTSCHEIYRIKNKQYKNHKPQNPNYIRDIFNIKNSNYQELDWTQKSPRVQIFRGEINYNVKDSKIITYKALISNLRSDSYVYVLAYYSPKYDKYYIPYHSIEELAKRSISLKLRMDITPDFTVTLQEFSKLRLYGYSAGISGLSDRSRQAIIKYVIDDNIMEPYEITSHLNWLIDFHVDRTDKDFSVAIGDWKNDIKFVYNHVNKKNKLPEIKINI